MLARNPRPGIDDRQLDIDVLCHLEVWRGLPDVVASAGASVPVPAGDYIYSYVERIEQCGNRIVDAGGGTIADARADGSAENGVHDVSAFVEKATKKHPIVAKLTDG